MSLNHRLCLCVCVCMSRFSDWYACSESVLAVCCYVCLCVSLCVSLYVCLYVCVCMSRFSDWYACSESVLAVCCYVCLSVSLCVYIKVLWLICLQWKCSHSMLLWLSVYVSVCLCVSVCMSLCVCTSRFSDWYACSESVLAVCCYGCTHWLPATNLLLRQHTHNRRSPARGQLSRTQH